MRLHGKSVIVTGGASGMGREIALRFGREGAAVGVVDRQESGAEVAGLLESRGQRSLFVQADVASLGDVEMAVRQCAEALGGVHVLISCAGVNPRGTVLTTSLDLWNQVLAVNLTATYLLARNCIPHMKRAGGGSIVTVASINALVAWQNEAAYEASKGGLVALTRAMAVDHAPDAIRVNCICPGIIDTPMLARTASTQPDAAAFYERAKHMQVAGRLGQPADIANAALFLASDESTFVTGAVLPVDGGYTAV